MFPDRGKCIPGNSGAGLGSPRLATKPGRLLPHLIKTLFPASSTSCHFAGQMEAPLDFTFSLHLSPWVAASLLSMLVRLLAARLQRARALSCR